MRMSSVPSISIVACAAGMAARVDFRRHHEAESVLPQRVAGDQDPVLGVVENERSHVVAGRRERDPLEIAPDVRRVRRKDAIDDEALRSDGRSSRTATLCRPSARRAAPRPRARRPDNRYFRTIAALPPT